MIARTHAMGLDYKWTMDVLLENARLTNFDLNGDNVISWEADRFGIGADMYNFTNLLLGAGERYADNKTT